ncbi:thiamine pyrophosphate-dependent enzyme [Streptomyces sp. CT34]|uniref:thiamine pyrophosphate-dependent enzyme n=1 Tax=Streptomyces sp. CT34 TaxID=1553907 RepID=UPI001F51A807|nr:thiamine pyrophosphate-dependent enzyme [Streptomyces sp. CT34]
MDGDAVDGGSEGREGRRAVRRGRAPGSVRDAVIDFCRHVGMDTVFGNPGSTELRLLRDWPEDLRFVLGLQESTVVAMAAGHALGTGRASLAVLHSAGGVGHALGAVVNAYRDRVPLVVLAGQQSRALLPYRPFLGADEPEQFPRPYVKWSRQPARGQDVPAAFAEAYRVAMTHPRGPVFLSVPEDDWDCPAAPVPPRAVYDAFSADPAALAELAAALDAARRPALVVGPGVENEGAGSDVVALAERARAAVYIGPLSGRSGFPETHPLFQGFLPPVRDRLADRLAGHDLIVALGAPLFTYHVQVPDPDSDSDSDLDPAYGGGGPSANSGLLGDGSVLYHLDCDPEQAAWLPVGTSILTTLRPAVRALTGLVRAVGPAAGGTHGDAAGVPGGTHGDDAGAQGGGRSLPPVRPRPAAIPPADPIPAGHVLDLLRERLPDGAVLVEEAPSHRDDLHARVPIERAGGFLTTGNGTLGWGLPLAVGRALAAGSGERVVCVLGDGSAMYSVQALWTAVRHRAPVTFVLLDNGGYEAVAALGRRIGLTDVPGTALGGIDFAGLAASFGCPSHRAAGAAELPGELDRALRRRPEDGPLLLEIPVRREESTLY